MRRLIRIVEGSPYPEIGDEEWAAIQAALQARRDAPKEPDSPAEEFQDAFEDARDRSGIDPAGKVSLYVRGEREVELLHIGVAPGSRGKGIANSLMALLCDMADAHGITLRLGIASDADEDTGLGWNDLHEWYQGWGFEGGSQMIREPAGAGE